MLTNRTIGAAEIRRQELLAEVARARFVASAYPARAPRPHFPSLAGLARLVHFVVAVLASVAFGTRLVGGRHRRRWPSRSDSQSASSTPG
jgi:hypothetical protein